MYPQNRGVAAPARRAHAVDQRRHAVPVDHAGRRDARPTAPAPASPTSPTCGSTPAAGRWTEGTPGATNDPGPGATTLYFPNDQSARFLYLHDDTLRPHAPQRVRGRGGAVLHRRPRRATSSSPATPASPASSRAIDAPVEAGTVPAAELPLLIEDKTFVPGAEQLRAQDPTWDVAAWGGLGALWYPARLHAQPERRRRQGARQRRPQRQGPLGLPPLVLDGLRRHRERPGGEPPVRDGRLRAASRTPGTPNPSVVPNAFIDTMLVNGTAYPYVKVERKAYRLRILNACGDRSLNLQLYYAKSNHDHRDRSRGGVARAADGLRRGAHGAGGRPAERRPWPVGWPTDGRAGGVPDPRAAGPDMIQIGNDGGLLPQAVRAARTRRSASREAADGEGLADGRRHCDRRHRRQDALPRAGRARRRDRRLLAGPARLQAHPLQRRAGAGAVRRQPRRLLHRRPRPDARSAARRARRPATAPTRARSCSSRSKAPPRRPFDLERAAAGAAGRLSRPPRTPSSSPRPPTTPRTARVLPRGPAPGGRHAHASRRSAAATRSPCRCRARCVAELFDPAYGRKTATLGVEAPLSASGVRTSVPYSAIDPATEFVLGADGRPRRASATARRCGASRTTAPCRTASTSAGSTSRCSSARSATARRARPTPASWAGRTRCASTRSSPASSPCARCSRGCRSSSPPASGLLDVTRPLGATGGFTELDPLTAAPETVVNRPADFSWEAYWGIHLQGGEESHTVRPLVDPGQPRGPEALTATAGDGPVVDSHVDGADLPAAGRRLRSGTRRRRELPQGPHVLRGGRRRRVPHRRLGAGRPHLLLPGAGRRRDGVLALVGAGRGGRAVADGRDRRTDRHTAERSSPDEEVPIRR